MGVSQVCWNWGFGFQSLPWELKFSREESRRQQLEGHTEESGCEHGLLGPFSFGFSGVILGLLITNLLCLNCSKKSVIYGLFFLPSSGDKAYLRHLFWNIVVCILLCLRECWSKMFALCSGFELGFTVIFYFMGKTQFSVSEFLNVKASCLR